jgi:hypothetical protein
MSVSESKLIFANGRIVTEQSALAGWRVSELEVTPDGSDRVLRIVHDGSPNQLNVHIPSNIHTNIIKKKIKKI